MRKLAAALLVALVVVAGLPLAALPSANAIPNAVPKKTWVTDGDVDAIVRHENTIYLGGSFTYLGPRTGPFAAVGANGRPDQSWPEFARHETGGDPQPPVVRAVAPDGSGGWYVGGNFTAVGGNAIKHLAHIKADKTVDTAFAPNPNSDVQALATRGSTLYVGGKFTSIGGQNRQSLAALDTAGEATSWNPSPDHWVFALAATPSTVYVGGEFANIGGQARVKLAAIDLNGNATAFNPSIEGDGVRALALSGSTLVVGGHFYRAGGQDRPGLAAFEVGSAAVVWGGVSGSFRSVHALAVSGSTVFVGGAFYNAGGQPRKSLAQLNISNGLATSWRADTGGEYEHVEALAVSGSTVYFGGEFTSVGPTATRYLAAVGTAGGLVSWNPNPDSPVLALGVSGSTVFAGGTFGSVGGVRRIGAAAIDATTGAGLDWNPTAGCTHGIVRSLAIAGANVVAGGTLYCGNPNGPHGILTSDRLTGAFKWGQLIGLGTVFDLAVVGSTVYAGGGFERDFGTGNRRNLAAFDATSGAASSFNPDVEGNRVYSLAASASRLFVGGQFWKVGGEDRAELAAVDIPAGTVAPWNPRADGPVSTLALSGSTLYAGGYFSQVAGQRRAGLAAIDPNTGVPTSWNPSGFGAVEDLAISGSEVIVGGYFGGERNRLAAVDAASGAASSWSPDPDSAVLAVHASNGIVYAGGRFNAVGRHPQRRFAAFDQAAPAVPETTITSGPAEGSTITQATATFGFTSSVTPATFECAVDGGAFTACTTPHTTGTLANGSHTFRVRAVAGGQTDPTPATRTFTVNVAAGAPETTITSGPAQGSTITQSTATFGFTSNAAGATFECSIDDAAFAGCTSPHTTPPLANGSHTFRVRAKSSGQTDPSPATRTFTVNVTTSAPDTVITSGPPDESSASNVEFEFHSQPSGVGETFECAMDGAAFAPCSSPHLIAGVPNGTHTFRVRAIAGGQTDPTPAERTFRINVTTPPPDTEILSGPAEGSTVTTTTARFEFFSHGSGATFQCSIDGSPFAACSSPYTTPLLSNGAHTFRVRAVAGGQADPSPATVNFTVNVPAPTPDTTITAGPAEGSTVTTQSVSFSFTSPTAGATFECSVDGADFASCGSPFVRFLANGQHTFRVRAVSGSQVDPTPATRSFTVQVAEEGLDTIITAGPAEGSTIATFIPQFSFKRVRAVRSPARSTGKASASSIRGRPARFADDFECSVNGGAFYRCGSPHAPAPLDNGLHVFRVRAIDGAQVDQTPAFRNFRIDFHPTVGVDIAYSKSVIKHGKNVKLVAVANIDMSTTPYTVEIYDALTQTVVKSCKSGRSSPFQGRGDDKCITHVVSNVPANVYYRARIVDTFGNVLAVSPYAVLIEWF